MAKRQDFASKIFNKPDVPTCPVCGEAYTFLKKVVSYPSEKTGTWKFANQNLKVCKCNEKAVYA